MQDPSDAHYQMVVNSITNSRLIPFLGAGANLCDRPDEKTQFEQGQYLPNGVELAEYLAKKFGCPSSGDLARVTQYIDSMGGGTGALYQALRVLFDADYPPTLLHKFLAVLPRVLRTSGLPPQYQLIVTTNYDDVLERTFYAAREEFDLVSYAAEGVHQGKFLHWAYAFKPKSQREIFQNEAQFEAAVQQERQEFDEHFWRHWPPKVEPRQIDTPNEYTDLTLEQRPVILKIHGAVDRITPPDFEQRLDSFVITEDNYIDYMSRADISSLVPANLKVKLLRSNFLFLGYSLRDWNLRVFLRRIWGAQALKWNSWAIQLKPEDLDQVLWMRRNVLILNAPLKTYITELIKRLHAESHISELEAQLANLKSESSQKLVTQGVGGNND
jgi:hypothetical protein